MDIILKDAAFFSEFDHVVIEGMKSYLSKFSELIRMALPSFGSLVLYMTLFALKTPLETYFWPTCHDPTYTNSAVAGFLMPSGFVFALSFGFMFEKAMERQLSVMRKITEELSMLDQILTLTAHFRFVDSEYAMAIYKAVKTEAIYMMVKIQNRPIDTFKGSESEQATGKINHVVYVIGNQQF